MRSPAAEWLYLLPEWAEFDNAGLLRHLEKARVLGFLGPGPVERHLVHAIGFAAAVGANQVASLLDLGSGAGVPGLILAAMMPEAEVVLLDANLRRTNFMTGAVEDLGYGSRVTVLRERAELVGRLPRWREAFDVVVARSFGSTGATGECGSSLVRVGGLVVVSEPPSNPTGPRGTAVPPSAGAERERWPLSGASRLGLTPRRPVVLGGFSFQVLDKTAPIDDRFPRRPGLPGQRPLF